MAGIGFRLRSILDKEHGLLHFLGSYGYAMATINGPMLLCIAGVGLIRFILVDEAYGGIPTGDLLTTITYAFVVSTIMTSGYGLVLTRNVSDCIFHDRLEGIMSSFYGGLIFAVSGGLFSALILWGMGGMNAQHAFWVFLFYSIVNIINLEMIYLSAVRNYWLIAMGFLWGNGLLVASIGITGSIPENLRLQYIFFCFCLGFSITSAILLVGIRRAFGEGRGKPLEWTTYFKRYPSLAMMDLVLYIGLYFVTFYDRFRGGGAFYNGFLTFRPALELPFYYAILSILPAMAYFVVRFETMLQTGCNAFYQAIQKGGTYDDIEFRLELLKSGIKASLKRMILVQLTVAGAMVLISLLLLGDGGWDVYKNVSGSWAPVWRADLFESTFSMAPPGSYAAFWMFLISFSAFLILNVCKIVLLYFDARAHSLFLCSTYAVLTVVSTLSLTMEPKAGGGYGLGGLIQGLEALPVMGSMTASVLSAGIAAGILMKFLRGLKYRVFIIRRL